MKYIQLALNIFSVLIITVGVLFCVIQSHLIIDEEAKPSDVIVVLSGSINGEREIKARTLLKEGFSNEDLIIPSPYTNDVKKIYDKLAIDTQNILPETNATSTYTNAENILKLMNEKDFKSAIIVSSDYHMRRVKLSFERVKKKNDYKISLNYVAAYHEVNGKELPWYKAGRYPRYVATEEFFKVIGYYLGLYKWINL